MKKAPTTTTTKPASTTAGTNATKATTQKPAHTSTTATKTTTTAATKSSVSNVKAATTKSSSSSTGNKVSTSKVANKAPLKVNDKAPAQEQPKEEIKAPEVKKMKVENINLKQLFNKIEEHRDSNRSLLIIDKLEANDSFTFFKYKGYVADVSEFLIREGTNAQNREKSIETARKQVVYSLKAGGTLVFFVDEMLVDLPNFFSGADFFAPEQLFIPSEAQKDSYYVKKLLKEEENVDGFGNKGGYYPNKDFAAVVLSKSKDLEPDELIKKLNMPAELFDCIIIS